MPALLELAGLRRRFGGVAALDGADLKVRAGTLTGLIGPNGAGKTTLFNAVSGLVPADSGTIRFDGEQIDALPPERVSARGLVRTFQVARGFPRLSVYDSLMLYGRNQPGERLWHAVTASAASRRREAELTRRARETAALLQLDGVLDHAAEALSGGQKKLLEIGRALMAGPKMILLDEPTAGVNPTLAADIAAQLKALVARGITVLLIEHDLALIGRLCDPVIVMCAGKVLTEGSFDEVTADTRVQEAYLGRRR